MSRKSWAVAAALSTVLGMLLLGGTAAAAPSSGVGITATGRSDIYTNSNPYVRGSGTFTWGTTTLTGAMSVRDINCDQHNVAIQIVVSDKDGDDHYGTVRWNQNACNGAYTLFDNLQWNNGNEAIAGFYVRGIQGAPISEIFDGNYVDNPLT